MEELMYGMLIPIIATVGFAIYTIRVLFLKDMRPLENGGPHKYKDKEKYRDTAGKLLLMMTIFSAVSGVLSLYHAIASFVVIAVGMLVFIILWKRMHDHYGW